MTANMFKGETHAERRKYQRKPIKLHVSYRCLEKGGVSAPQADLAEDLGAGGLLMHSVQALPIGQIVMLVLFLPPVEKRQDGVATEECAEEE
ncbi:hypothetical protein JW933_02075, partial [candidate division FCPU426 bacterium]|nr:hypothetical protein [candidate division FCPU426 bacterium]